MYESLVLEYLKRPCIGKAYTMEIHCPHCQQKIWIEQLNCGIFRCGMIKETGDQIPPHATKEECDTYLNQGIYGCGKPFQIVEGVVTKCDYI